MKKPSECDLPDEAREVLDLWLRLRGDRPLPVRADFRPIDWRAWLSDISLVEVHEGARRYFVSLHAGRTQDNIGANFHKRYLEDVVPPETRALALPPYEESERTGLPTLSTMTPNIYPSMSFALWRLVLPFTSDASEGVTDRVDRFVVWVGVTTNRPFMDDSVYETLRMNLGGATNPGERVNLSILSV